MFGILSTEWTWSKSLRLSPLSSVKKNMIKRETNLYKLNWRITTLIKSHLKKTRFHGRSGSLERIVDIMFWIWRSSMILTTSFSFFNSSRVFRIIRITTLEASGSEDVIPEVDQTSYWEYKFWSIPEDVMAGCVKDGEVYTQVPLIFRLPL